MEMFIKVVLIATIMRLSALSSTNAKSLQTKIVFYMHDTLTGKNVTAVTVVGSSINSTLPFGDIVAMDDLLTEGPDPLSKQLDRAQGIYVSSSLDGTDFHLLFSMVFTEGKFNGSTLEVQGADRILLNPREVSIVSGTGKFRFVRGYALIETYSLTGLNAVLKYRVFVKYPA